MTTFFPKNLEIKDLTLANEHFLRDSLTLRGTGRSKKR